jgi:hypothetical protein
MKEPEAPTLSGYQRLIPNITEMVKEAQGEPLLEAVEADWEVFDPLTPWELSALLSQNVDLIKHVSWGRISHQRDELLEALELLVDTYEDGGWPSATIVIAKAAIAKAKGESIR